MSKNQKGIFGVLIAAVVLATMVSCSKGPKVEVYAFKCGVLKTQTQYMLKDTRIGTPMDIPVTFFLIKHDNDWVAFDLGNNNMVAKDPVGYWSKPVCDAYTPVMAEYEEFQLQIKKAFNLEPKDLKAVVLSHGHLDHAGALDNFRGADTEIYLQKIETKMINKVRKENKIQAAYIPADFKDWKEVNIKTVEGVYDIFGDKSIVMFPTPGHTAGHQSLMVRASNGKSYVLTADAQYTNENMYEAVPPGLAYNIPDAVQGLYTFKIMSFLDDDVRVVPSHDPEYWKDKPLAPKPFDI